MRGPKKITVRVAAAAGLLLLVIAAVLVLLPHIINLEPVKAKIIASLCGQIRCETFDYESIEFAVFPRPHVRVEAIRASLADDISGQVESLAVYPRILPLLRGDVKLAGARISGPQITLPVPEVLRLEERERRPFSISELRSAARSLIDSIKERLPDAFLEIDRGAVTLIRSGEPFFQFKDINGRATLPPGEIELELSCGSNLWDSLAIDARLDPDNLTNSGRFKLVRFRPRPAADYIFPDSPIHLGDPSEINVDIAFGVDEKEGSQTFHAGVKGSIPSLAIVNDEKGKTVTVRADSLEGNVKIDSGSVVAQLADVDLQSPRIRITGRLAIDSASRASNVHLTGADADATAVREFVLALAGDNKSVRDVFDIVRGGRVPWITWNAWGETPADFEHLDNMVIEGEMADGIIGVPHPELEVVDTRGQVNISNGILEGWNLFGRTGNSFASNGLLTIGLKAGEKPFHLDLDLDADLAELPPILRRVVKNEQFLHELDLIGNVEGRADGKLLLGESTSSVEVLVDARRFRLSGDYKRIPHPLLIGGGSLLYTTADEYIRLESVSGHVGSSTFSGVTTRVGWEKGYEIEVIRDADAAPAGSAPTRLDLDELQPWLASYESIRDFFRKFNPAGGDLFVETFHLEGPLLSPREWRIQGLADMKDVTISGSLFNAPLNVKSGRLGATPGKLTLEELQVRFMDASLAVSGTLEDYMKGVTGIDLALKGSVGLRASREAAEAFDLPPRYRPDSALKLSAGRFSRSDLRAEGARTAFSGNLAANENQQVALDVVKTPNRLSVDKLAIKDRDSDASISFTLEDKIVDLRFSGTLTGKTLDRLFIDNDILAGRVTGNAAVRFQPDAPLASTATGSVLVEGFQYKGDLKDPIHIEKASVTASGRNIRIDSADLQWNGSDIRLQGSVEFSREAYLIDLDAWSNALNWNLIEDMREEGKDRSKPRARPSGIEATLEDIPVKGELRAHVDTFTYGKYNLKALRGVVGFAPKERRIQILDSNLCGITIMGNINLTPEGTQLALNPIARRADLLPTLTCLGIEDRLLTGTFTLNGSISAFNVKEGSTLGFLDGEVETTAEDGRLYRLGFVEKVFQVINVTEIFRGKLPDLANEGCPYDRAWMKGSIEDGKLTIKNALIDSQCMKMVWNGVVDLQAGTMDFIVLVSPLRTVDRIVGNIPIVGEILGGSLLTIPVEVTGDINDPSVIPLSPSAIGSELFGYMERTFKLPFTLFQPLQQ